MALKDLWSKTNEWLRSHKPSTHADYQPEVDDEDLITQTAEPEESAEGTENAQRSTVLVKKTRPLDKAESLEKLQEGFNKLIDQLQGINAHLSRQLAQHEELTSRMDKLPGLLENFPAVVENQKRLTEQLMEQLKAAAVKNEQFIDVVEKIPTETAKQSDALEGIDHQLASVADTNVQMADNFNKFTETLDKLNNSTVGQTDGIMQLSRTFAASDRYLKYIMSRQHRRLVWMFVITVGVCVAVILIMTGVILYLGR